MILEDNILTGGQCVQMPLDKGLVSYSSKPLPRPRGVTPWHMFPCLIQPLVNLTEVFSRLGMRLNVGSWLGLGPAVKNHIPSIAPQNLKARMSAAASATVRSNGCEWPC